MPFIILIFLVFLANLKILKKSFSTHGRNKPMYSWGKLGVLSTPYDLPKTSTTFMHRY